MESVFAQHPSSTDCVGNSMSRRSFIGRTGALGVSAALLGPVTARADPATPVSTPTRDVPPEPSIGVIYGEVDGETLLLDVYPLPPRAAPRPAMLMVHGGYLAQGSRDEVAFIVPLFTELGCVVFNVDYRLLERSSGRNAWPAQLDDVQRAVRWVRAHAPDYNVDPARVGVWGHSSGGQLAAFLGVTDTRDTSVPELAAYSSRVTCVIDVAGDADVTVPYTDPTANLFNESLYGGTLESAPEAYRAASARYHVDREAVPFLILHGLEDVYVPLAMSWNLTQALHENETEVIFAQLAGADHVLTGAEAMVDGLINAFVDRHLSPGE